MILNYYKFDFLEQFFCSQSLGTLWCGLGDIARKNSDLGMYTEMDECCRTHDSCEDYIEPKSARYGLYNEYICRG